MFLAPKKRLPRHHDSPPENHNFTTKTPRPKRLFPGKPPVKTPFTMAKNN
jgi:hypothetical protein